MLLRFIDFEFNSSHQPKYNLVSYAERAYDTETKANVRHTLWLHQTKYVPPINRGIFVAFNVIAEASAMYSWGVDPTKYQWIDLQAEYRMLTNHWDKYRHGKQLMKHKVITTHNPKKKRENAKVNTAKPETSLAAALFKMLKIEIDTDHKDEIRNLIIRNDPEEIEAHKDEILEYNLSDVEHLPALFSAIVAAERSAGVYDLKQMLERGSSVAHTALLSMRGYPVNVKQLRNFAQSIPDILRDTQEHINEQFPEMKVFHWDKKNKRYSMKQKPVFDWIESQSGKAEQWPLTESGKFSLSFEDAWSQLYSFRSPYPEGNFAAQMYRYLRLRQSLNGFLPKSLSARDRTTFFSYLGRDSRVRPYLNPYGAQSSRFQPKATGYLPLKPSWMRCFILPPEGRAICGIDYKSQEFLIAGLLSNDEAMIASYESGDVYADFAARAGALDGISYEDPNFKRIRNKFKSTVLGIQYLMGPDSLAAKLTADTGELHTRKDAEELIELFSDVYHVFDDWRHDTVEHYLKRKKLQLADGWTMFGDNANMRSVANCPVQGTGAVVLRRAIKLAHINKLEPVLPLHDALYIEFDHDKLNVVDKFSAVMRKAFIDSIDHEKASAIKIDVYAISRHYRDELTLTPGGREIHLMSKYVEDRSRDEYDRFKKYFERRAKA